MKTFDPMDKSEFCEDNYQAVVYSVKKKQINLESTKS